MSIAWLSSTESLDLCRTLADPGAPDFSLPGVRRPRWAAKWSVFFEPPEKKVGVGNV